MRDRFNQLKLRSDRVRKFYIRLFMCFVLSNPIVQGTSCWRILVSLTVIWLPLPSLSFRASIGCPKIISQISLELVIISDALHAPDDQLLTKNVIRQRHMEMNEGGTSIPALKSSVT